MNSISVYSNLLRTKELSQLQVLEALNYLE